MVCVVKSPSCLGTSSRITYETHGANDLVFISVPIESKYLVSSVVVQNGANSSETARYDECLDHVLDKLKAALEVFRTHASRTIDDKTKIQFCFAN